MQQLYGLAAQLAIERAPVGLGQLAGAVVHLGVADLGVLGVARGLEVGALGRARGLALGPPAGPQRRADHQHGDRHHDEHQQDLHRGGYARSSSRATRARPAAVAGRRARAPAGQSAIAAPANTISAPSQIQVTSGDAIRRNVAGGGESV